MIKKKLYNLNKNDILFYVNVLLILFILYFLIKFYFYMQELITYQLNLNILLSNKLKNNLIIIEKIKEISSNSNNELFECIKSLLSRNLKLNNHIKFNANTFYLIQTNQLYQIT